MQATVVAFASATAIGGCASHGVNEEPFVVPPDTVFSRIQTVVVTPISATGGLVIPDDAAAVLEAAFEEKLQDAGFNVVPAFEYIGTWQHIADEFGGFFDPYTGERDQELFSTATNRMRSELQERFHADAIVFPELWEGTVPFRDGVAEWDGTSQAVFGAYSLSGMVRALSLVVVIEDLEGNELYSNWLGFATIDAWQNNRWLPMVLGGVVGDPRLVAKTVSGVLEPLVEARNADSIPVR